MWLDQEVVNFWEEIKGNPVMHLRKMQQLARAQVHHNNQHYRQQYLYQQVQGPPAPVTYAPGQAVWIRLRATNATNKKFAQQWEEGRVIRQLHEHVYRISRPNRNRHKEATVNAQDLKPRVEEARQPEQEQQQAPPPEEKAEESDFEEDWPSSDEEEEEAYPPPPHLPRHHLPAGGPQPDPEPET